MTTCKGCKFSVTKDMRFALMKNICPSCGQALFGDSELQEITEIKNKILGQEFSQELSSQIVHDIALFIFREIESLLPNAEPITPKSLESKESSEEETKEDIEARIRAEVENELANELNALDSNEDDDHKIARLKRVAKESKIKRSTTVVSRLGTEEL